MKTFTRTTVSALALMAVSTAGVAAMDINETVANELQQFGYDVEAMDLTTEQVAEVTSILNSDDNRTDKKSRLDVVLAMDPESVPGPSLEGNVEDGQIVAQSLSDYGYDVAPESLTTSDVAELKAVIESEEATSAKMSEIDQILARGEITFTALDGDTMLRRSVGNELQALGIEADVDTLSATQLAELRTLFSTEESKSEKVRQAEAIIAG